MKIIYASSVDLSLPRGPSVNEREFCGSLSRMFRSDAVFIIPRPSVDTSGVLKECDGSTVEILPVFKKRRPFSWFVHQFRLFQRCRKVANRFRRNERPLFVFRLDYMPVGIALFVLTRTPRYVVKTAGDGSFSFLRRHGLLVRWSGPLNRLLHKCVLGRAHFIDVVTERHARDLSRNLGIDRGRIGVVDNAVNTERFVPMDSDLARQRVGLERFERIIGYVGNEPWCRGGRELIQVAEELRDRNPGLGIVIVGGGPRLCELEEEVRSRKLEEFVVLAGQVNYAEVVHYINSFDVGVSFLEPHHRGASEQKVRQYISCGRPAVVTPGGSEFVAEAGIGAAIDTVNERLLVETLLDWLRMAPQVREKCVEYARLHLSVDARLEERLERWRQAGV